MNSENERTTCRHHWVIEPANGRLSAGRCKRCGDSREFINSPDDARIDSNSNAKPVTDDKAAPVA